MRGEHFEKQVDMNCSHFNSLYFDSPGHRGIVQYALKKSWEINTKIISSKLADSNQNTCHSFFTNHPYNLSSDLHCQCDALSVAENLVQVLRTKDVSQ